jgi:hypothetical protein
LDYQKNVLGIAKIQRVREQIGGATSTIATAYKRFRGIAQVETTQIDPSMK